MRSLQVAIPVTLVLLLIGCEPPAATCRPSETECFETCVDLDRDPENCGACGTACASDEVCEGGQCLLDCRRDACDDGCTDLDSDPGNCGACGNACEPGEGCVDGACVLGSQPFDGGPDGPDGPDAMLDGGPPDLPLDGPLDADDGPAPDGVPDAPPPDAPSPDGPMPVLDCEFYCTEILAACSGAQAQYANATSCAGFCALLPRGTLADTSGNTLGCRINRTLALSNPGAECVAAGPSGGDASPGGASGACGDICDAFCAAGPTRCPDELSQCDTLCAGLPGATTGYSLSHTSGNDVACRLYYLTRAFDEDPILNCSQTAVGSDFCIP